MIIFMYHSTMHITLETASLNT